MNFAPYQDESPEVERALSPPLGRTKPTPPPQISSPPPFSYQRAANTYANNSSNGYMSSSSTGFGSRDLESGTRANLAAFETSLPIRVDYEAMMAYLLLPPAGGVLLLLLEHKSDYVRFHAWQSSMLFSAIFILHLIFSWSSFISWLMLLGDICLIAYLSLRAYRDVDSLEHYEVPIFGRLANSFVDDE